MPTASEYKHEPVGLPCNCYIRRRINSTLHQKSCLRKSEKDLSTHKFCKKAPKTVTFDPVLQICFYKSTSKSDKYQKVVLNIGEAQALPHKPTYQLFAELGKTDLKSSRQPDKLGSAEDAEPTQIQESPQSPKIILQNTGRSVTEFGSSACGTSEREHGDDPVQVDENNNDSVAAELEAKIMDCARDHRRIYGNQRCSAGAACKYAYRQRERTTAGQGCGVHDGYGGASETVGEPVLAASCRDRCSSSGREYGNFGAGQASSPTAADANSSSSSSSSNGGGSSSSYRKQLSARSSKAASSAAVSPYRVSGRNLGADCVHSPHTVDECGTCPPAYDLNAVPAPAMSTFRSSSDKESGSAAATAASVRTHSSNADDDDDDRTTEKSDEYIYAAPDNKCREYEYVPVKSSAFRRRTESENLDSCPTVPVFEPNQYGYGFAKHKTEIDLLTADKCSEKSRQRADVSTPQSAPDLQTIMSSPYDIKFLNECVKAYVRSTGDDQIEIDILAKYQKVEKTGTSPLGRKSDAPQRSIIDDIFSMTPVALFWTGCAFLVALIYIILFSCTKDQE